MTPKAPLQRHPLRALAILILLMVVGSLVFGLLGMAIGGAFYGLDAGSTAPFLKILQFFLATGTFVVPAWYFARFSDEPPLGYLQLNTPSYPVLFVLTLVVLLSASAPIDLLAKWNQQLELPGFLKGLEAWMKQKEQETAELIKQLSVMKNPADLIINLLVLAALPALGEEMVFRGIIQKLFIRWTQNAHWGIWIAAMIFSAIHLQFYGFLPRMVLGALFGYLLLWSNNLWLPIWGHFLNNAAVVWLTYQHQMKGLSLDKLDDIPQQSWSVYLINTLITLSALGLFYRYAQVKKQINHQT